MKFWQVLFILFISIAIGNFADELLDEFWKAVALFISMVGIVYCVYQAFAHIRWI